MFVATKLVCSQEFWDIDSHVCGEKTAVFVETLGHLHPKFVIKQQAIETFPFVSAATKSNIYEEMSGHLLSCLWP